EALALAIELPVIVVGERRSRVELAREQAARERHAREEANALRLSGREEFVGGLEPEHVEDDLDALDVRVFDRLRRLRDGLDAHAVVAKLSGGDEVIEHAEDLWSIEDRGVRAVQLEKIEPVDFKILEAAIDPGGQVLARVPVGRLDRQTPASLGRDVDRLAGPLAAKPGNEALAAAVAVDVRGVDEVDTGVDRGVQRAHRLVIVHRAPGAA